MKKFFRAIVSGEVQGVGYRYAVYHIAQALLLKGFVRNLPDGTVEVQAEGEAAALEQFLEKIRMRNGGIMVDDLKLEWRKAEGKFASFSIVRGPY